MTMKMSRLAAAASFALLLALGASPVRAAVHGGTGEIEIAAGWYWPEHQGPAPVKDNLDNWTWGVRGGWNVNPKFGIKFEVQNFDTSYNNTVAPTHATWDDWMGDLSFEWQVNPTNRAVFVLYGGPGYAWQHYSDNLGKSASADVWTAHVGIGAKINIAGRFYIRPDARVRWYADDNTHGVDNHTDWQATVGFGWELGANAAK